MRRHTAGMSTALGILGLLGAALSGLLGLGLLVFSLWPLSEQGQAEGALTAGLVFAGLGLLGLVGSGALAWWAVRRLRARPPR